MAVLFVCLPLMISAPSRPDLGTHQGLVTTQYTLVHKSVKGVCPRWQSDGGMGISIFVYVRSESILSSAGVG